MHVRFTVVIEYICQRLFQLKIFVLVGRKTLPCSQSRQQAILTKPPNVWECLYLCLEMFVSSKANWQSQHWDFPGMVLLGTGQNLSRSCSYSVLVGTTVFNCWQKSWILLDLQSQKKKRCPSRLYWVYFLYMSCLGHMWRHRQRRSLRCITFTGTPQSSGNVGISEFQHVH